MTEITLARPDALIFSTRVISGACMARSHRQKEYFQSRLTVSCEEYGTQPKEKTKMKRRILITAALAMLATTAASAQTINVRAKVPFSFAVGSSILPAGEYSLQTLGFGNALAMRNRDANVTKLVLSTVCQSRTATKNKLIFHRYGDAYFLSQIWTEGNSLGYEIPKSAREKEMATNYSKEEVVLLALNR